MWLGENVGECGYGSLQPHTHHPCMVLTIVITMHFFPTSRSLFLGKSHWTKIKISGIVELGVLMRFHYRTDFRNPVVVLERGAHLGKIRKQVPKTAL